MRLFAVFFDGFLVKRRGNSRQRLIEIGHGLEIKKLSRKENNVMTHVSYHV